MVHAAGLPRQPASAQNGPTPDTRPCRHPGPQRQTTPDSGGKTVVFIDCGPWFGGAQRSLLTLASGLRDVGYTPVLLAADATDGGLVEQAQQRGLAAQHLPVRHWRKTPRGMVHFFLDRRRSVPLIREAVRRYGASVVHANGLRAALLACPATPPGTPSVVHARDVREPALLRRWTASRANAVIAISRTVASRWAVAGAERCRVQTIHNGFDLGEWAEVRPADGFPWHEEHLTATLVADMVRWKRHDLFLASLREAHARDPRIRGVVVGRPLNRQGGRWLQFLKERSAALGLAEVVAFVTDARSALPWIEASYVVVSTADAEPFGRTIVEALALGKPVVAVRGGGPEEILAGTGAGLVTDASPACLAASILEFADPERRRRAEEAARRRAGDFTARRMVDQVRTLYESLLRTSDSPSSAQ